MDMNEDNTFFNLNLQEKLSRLKFLSKTGPLSIMKDGARNGKIIKALRANFANSNSNLGLVAEDSNAIKAFQEEFRNLIKQHKEYVQYNSSIVFSSIDYKLQHLLGRLTVLQERMGQLTENINDFLLQKRLALQEDNLVALAQESSQVFDNEISNQKNQENMQIVTNTIDNQAEIQPTPSKVEVMEPEVDYSVLKNAQFNRQNSSFQFTVPLKVSRIQNWRPEKWTHLNWFNSCTINPELQLQVLKTASGQNQFFIGVNFHFNLHFCNSKKVNHKNVF